MLGRINRSAALASVALVVALASSSYAAGVLPLPAASVGSRQLKLGAATAVKIAARAVGAPAVGHGTLLRRDLAAAVSRNPQGPVGSAGPTGDPVQRGTAGAGGATGPAGGRGPAGAAGLKGAPGDPGTTPFTYTRVITLGEVDVAANDEATSTLACPAGMRVLSGSEQDGAIIGDPRTSVTIEASEPNASGTGWTVTMRAGAVDSHFQIVAICAVFG